MSRFSDTIERRRLQNAPSLAAIGHSSAATCFKHEAVLVGDGPTVFTIGYEKRDGDQLFAALLEAEVDVLVDVRQRAMSRKADFRGGSLARRCQDAGIEYHAMSSLGSTDELRDQLRETGDFKRFAKRFESLARRKMNVGLQELADLASQKRIALLCYERCHHECHRSVLGSLLHESEDMNIIAIN